jgi:hypothetical protein
MPPLPNSQNERNIPPNRPNLIIDLCIRGPRTKTYLLSNAKPCVIRGEDNRPLYLTRILAIPTGE